jgi:hypothetical protein
VHSLGGGVLHLFTGVEPWLPCLGTKSINDHYYSTTGLLITVTERYQSEFRDSRSRMREVVLEVELSGDGCLICLLHIYEL